MYKPNITIPCDVLSRVLNTTTPPRYHIEHPLITPPTTHTPTYIHLHTHLTYTHTVMLPFEVLRLMGIYVQPYKRGYYLNEPSISKLYHSSTVKSYTLVVVGVVVNFVAVSLVGI